MFTVIWAITFFNSGHTALALGDTPFIGLIIALLADFVFIGWGKRFYFRA